MWLVHEDEHAGVVFSVFFYAVSGLKALPANFIGSTQRTRSKHRVHEGVRDTSMRHLAFPLALL